MYDHPALTTNHAWWIICMKNNENYQPKLLAGAGRKASIPGLKKKFITSL
jgi:hypothetical protein